MKKLEYGDGTIVETEIGWSNDGWSIPDNVKRVEFEDGKILENPNYVEKE